MTKKFKAIVKYPANPMNRTKENGERRNRVKVFETQFVCNENPRDTIESMNQLCRSVLFNPLGATPKGGPQEKDL